MGWPNIFMFVSFICFNANMAQGDQSGAQRDSQDIEQACSNDVTVLKDAGASSCKTALMMLKATDTHGLMAAGVIGFVVAGAVTGAVIALMVKRRSTPLPTPLLG